MDEIRGLGFSFPAVGIWFLSISASENGIFLFNSNCWGGFGIGIDDFDISWGETANGETPGIGKLGFGIEIIDFGISWEVIIIEETSGIGKLGLGNSRVGRLGLGISPLGGDITWFVPEVKILESCNFILDWSPDAFRITENDGLKLFWDNALDSAGFDTGGFEFSTSGFSEVPTRWFFSFNNIF